MKMSHANKTLILTIVLTLAVSLFFGAIVYAFNDKVDFGDKMEQGQMKEDRGGQSDDNQRGPKGNRQDSRSDDGTDSDKNFGSEGKPDFDRNDENFDKETIGELKSIDGSNVVITLKTRSRDKDSDDNSEDKTYTVASDVDLASFAVGDTVKFEADDNNQITSMEKFELKDKQQKQNYDSGQQQDQNKNSSQQQDQKQTSFSKSI